MDGRTDGQLAILSFAGCEQHLRNNYPSYSHFQHIKFIWIDWSLTPRLQCLLKYCCFSIVAKDKAKFKQINRVLFPQESKVIQPMGLMCVCSCIEATYDKRVCDYIVSCFYMTAVFAFFHGLSRFSQNFGIFSKKEPENFLENDTDIKNQILWYPHIDNNMTNPY